MIPLHRDTIYTYRFADDRLIGRFHLADAPAGQRVVVYRLEGLSTIRGDRLLEARVGANGWVELTEPLIMRTGEGFIASCE